MTQNVDVLIIGSGLAGYWAADALREANQEIAITMVTEGDGGYYHKPQLSQGYTLDKQPNQMVLKTAEQKASELKMDVLTHSTVTRINTKHKTAEIAGEHQGVVHYQVCLMAAGSEPIRVIDHENVHSINDFAQLHLALEGIEPKQKIAILGSGLVGCELAFDFSVGGHQVQLISLEEWPLCQMLPQALGQIVINRMESVGIQWHGGQRVSSFIPNDGFKSTNGQLFTADRYFSCIGVAPRVDLAKSSGLNVKQGIQTNQYGQTQDPYVFALGDCANIAGQNRVFVGPIRHQVKVIAQACLSVLEGKGVDHLTPIQYPAMPVMCKNKYLPIRGAFHPNWKGQWDEIIVDGDDGFAITRNTDNAVTAFACVGKSTEHLWPSLLKQMDPFLSE